MDQILEGTLASGFPEELKLAIIEKVMSSTQMIRDKDTIEKILRFCCKTFASNKADFDIMVNERILIELAKTRTYDVADFFNMKLNIAIESGLFEQEDESKEKRDLLELIAHVVPCIKAIDQGSTEPTPVQSLYDTMISCFLIEKSVSACALLANILVTNWKKETVKLSENALLGKMINLLCSFSLKFNLHSVESPVAEITKRVSQAHMISSLFSKVNETNEKCVFFALMEILKVLCQDEAPPSVTLTPLLTSIPVKYVKFAADAVCTNHQLKDQSIELVLCRLIDWLVWPGSKNLDIWIITLCKSLLSDEQRYKLVTNVIRKKAVVVFNNLFCEVSRENALSVFSFMMLAYQQSPEVFYKVAPRLPALFVVIEKGPTPNRAILQALAELTHTLVLMFPGTSSAHSNLLSAIKNYPQPSVIEMKRWLSNYSIIESKNVQEQIQPIQPKKEIIGKTGLINLGSTCYMNSVIQAFFMLKSFRSKILSMSLNSAWNPVTHSMAKLFAFLRHSERLAISPTNFCKVSRPPWFRVGTQQDCSEFLKYLIEKIEQEDKFRLEQQAREDPIETGKTMIHEFFTGQCKVNLKCKGCGYLSSRFEAFTDVPLAFSDALEDHKRAFSLKGGDISGGFEDRVKVNEALSSSEKGEVMETGKGGEIAQSHLPATEHLPHDHQLRTAVENTAKPINLQDLFDSYLSAEILHGQNQYRCDNCASLQDAEQKHIFTMCPKFLILTLKRFTYDAKAQKRGKIMHNIKFPYKLTVPMEKMTHSEPEAEICPMDCDSSFVHKDDVILSGGCPVRSAIISNQILEMNREQMKTYSLVAIIVHTGISSESGHYYCYCRNVSSIVADRESQVPGNLSSVNSSPLKDGENPHMENNENLSRDQMVGNVNTDFTEISPDDAGIKDEWYLFNDSFVTRVHKSDVEKIQTDHSTDTPYVFIYQESSIDDLLFDEEKIGNDLLQLVESDNMEYRKERQKKEPPLAGSSVPSKLHKWDDDDKDDNNGGNSFMNWGGTFENLNGNPGRFIY